MATVNTSTMFPEKEPVDPKLPNSNIDKMFPEGGPGAVVKLTPDQKLAQYVGQEELGTAGLEDISVRGDIAAGDTQQEKINAFKKAYPDGDLVFVRRCNDAKDGDIVIALIDDEATCKTFYREGKKIRLQPENSTMDPIYVSRNMFRDTMILGVVIGLYRSL